MGRVYYTLGAVYYFYNWMVGLGAASAATGGLAKGLNLFDPTLAFAVAFLVGVPGAIIWVDNARKQSQSLNPGLEILNESAIYTISDSGVYHYTKRLNVKAKQSGVDRYRTKFKWTGEGPIDIEAPLPGQDYNVLDDDVYDLCEVTFGAGLKKRTTTDVELTMTLQMQGREPDPYLSRLVDEQFSGGLTLKVNLPTGHNITNYKKEIYAAPRALSAVKEETEELDDMSREITWNIKRPRIGYRYVIRWYSH